MIDLSDRNSIYDFIKVSNTTDMEIIYNKILNNEIECDKIYLNKCLIIKELFLNKINLGMDFPTYKKYKKSFKYLSFNDYIYIDNLITILKLPDNELLKKISEMIENDKYNNIILKEKDETTNYQIIAINTLCKLNHDIYNFIIKYIHKIIENKTNKEIIDMYNDTINGNSFYNTVLKEIYIDNYKYLENTLFKELYLTILNDFDKVFIRYFRNIINYLEPKKITYDMYPYNASLKYGGKDGRKYFGSFNRKSKPK